MSGLQSAEQVEHLNQAQFGGRGPCPTLSLPHLMHMSFTHRHLGELLQQYLSRVCHGMETVQFECASCHQQGNARSKTLLQQNPPVLNWGCRLTQVVLYNGRKTVVVVCEVAFSSVDVVLQSVAVARSSGRRRAAVVRQDVATHRRHATVRRRCRRWPIIVSLRTSSHDIWRMMNVTYN